ncbi:hypothetical protein AB0368_10890 [Actinoplanes sp. NPDC051475]|uniref:hypothetical protein n=1 Tax=Actinoplanes sp. NPDC051475 TaxID=3157225 RepID=UPI00344DBD25
MTDAYGQLPDLEAAGQKWLTDQWLLLQDEVGAALSLETGWKQAVLPGAAREALADDVAGVLDLDGGLARVLRSADASYDDSHPGRPPSTSGVRGLLDVLAMVPASLRLAMRSLALECGIGIGFVQAPSVAADIAARSTRGSRVALELADGFRDRATDAGPVGGDRARRVVRFRYLAYQLARDLAQAGRLAEALVGDLSLPSSQAMANGLRRQVAAARGMTDELKRLRSDFGAEVGAELELARALVREIGLLHDESLDLVGNVADAVRSGHRLIHQVARRLGFVAPGEADEATPAEIRSLLHAMNDLVGADLRELDLSRVDLRWVRWSEATKWPEPWAGRVREMSILISAEEGVWEVRDGRRRPADDKIPTHR